MLDKSFLESEYALAAGFFAEVTRMRTMWHAFHPSPPFTRGDLALLGAVHEHSIRTSAPLTMSELARMLRQSPPAISRRAGELEEQGFLERVGDAGDRRIIYIRLTDKGNEMAHEAIRHFLGSLEKFLTGMGEEKAQTLTTLMHEFNDSVEQLAQNQI